jgi:hypothetical protein
MMAPATRVTKIQQNAEKMLMAFAEHWEHATMPEAWGPAAHGLLGGALAGIANIKARRGEIQASLRLMTDRGYIQRTPAPDVWITEIGPMLKQMYGEDRFDAPQKAQQLVGESSDPDYWWYILTNEGREHARWLKLPGWRRAVVLVVGFVRRHLVAFIIGFIASLAAGIVLYYLLKN